MLGPVDVVAEIDSTNRALLARARNGEPAGAVLVADHQTAGRGRLGRVWEATPGSALLVSVLLRPRLAPARAHLVTFAAGLAAVDACVTITGYRPGLKWPNDLVVEDDRGTRKLAGLLAESVVDGGQLSAVVVGMGMNLRVTGVPDGGVALDEVLGSPVDRDALLHAWLERFDERLTEVGTDRLLTSYREASATIGRDVRVELADANVEGRAMDVGPDGQLELLVDGNVRSISAGDVVHLRKV